MASSLTCRCGVEEVRIRETKVCLCMAVRIKPVGTCMGRNMTWRIPRQKGKPSGLDDVVAHISELYYCVFLSGRSSSGEKKWGKPSSPWRSWNKPLHNKPRSNLLEVKRKDMLLHTGAFRSQKPEMTSVPKRRGNFGNVANRRLVPLISKQFEVPRQKCFDWCCQDVEGWRTQKEKDRQRQKKSRAKKSLRRKTLRKLLSWRCDALSKFDSKDLQFVPAPDDLKTSQSYEEELILEEGSTQRGECPQASEAGQRWKARQGYRLRCYQPFPTLILGCFIWFKIIFLFSISFI